MERKIEYLLDSKGLRGYRPIFYEQGDGLTNGSSEYDLEQQTISSSDYPTSYLGTVIIAPVTLKSEDGTLSLRLDTVLLQISMQKQIVTTALQGVSGTIKEYIADGDYAINITGMLVDPGHDYPTAEVEILHELCLLSESLVVESELLQLLGIYNLVIESYSFADKQGFENVQEFELQCLSDNPIELIIEDETLN